MTLFVVSAAEQQQNKNIESSLLNNIVKAVLRCCMYLYLLLRKPGNDHRLVTTFDLISAQRATPYYHLWQRILRRSPNAVQLCTKDSLAFTHSTFFCGEAMFEVRVCKRKRCLRNFCRRVGVVRPHTFPTQRVIMLVKVSG